MYTGKIVFSQVMDLVPARRFHTCVKRYSGDYKVKHFTLYALDASTIDLCLSLFPWARFRRHKAAIKFHTLMDLRGNIPTFIHISDGKLHDVNVLDILLPEPGAIYVVDRGYLDYERLYKMNLAKAFFVTRAKKNSRFRRRKSRPVDKSTGLRCDQTVVPSTFYASKNYPEPLRRVCSSTKKQGHDMSFSRTTSCSLR